MRDVLTIGMLVTNLCLMVQILVEIGGIRTDIRATVIPANKGEPCGHASHWSCIKAKKSKGKKGKR